ncbi:hypothetical protein [Bartonella sp. WD16.2]|uniref:hypothetical protein n=1 Tax=Bartonella sp. WD16.2 TaxID=1933904 RepID=UPI0009C1FD1E|nr:hypothetical protein [Bartonella sp. WD16.2]AQX19991.1 hypothetical protein BWD162_008790 [Bartonella sp. WD16.2]
MAEKLKQVVEENLNTVGMIGYWKSFISGTDAARFGRMIKSLKVNIAIRYIDQN